MLKGIYAAASGMAFQMKQVEAISHNLANINTTGYQKVDLVGRSFGDMVLAMQNPTGVGVGVSIDGMARSTRAGNLKVTDNPLNVALQSPGYFLVRNAQGQEVMTRNGDFTLNAQSYLVTKDGEAVLDTRHRPIRIIGDPEQLQIREDGTLVMGGEPGSRLMVVNPPADANFPVVPQGTPPVQEATIRQKVIEESNVELINEMVTMLNANRLYNFAQKAITTQDNVLNKTANDLGRVQ